MDGRLRSFHELVQSIKDVTGISNMRNMYPLIRRHLMRCQFDIGYSDALTLKKYKYTKENNTIVNKRLKIPADFVYLDKLATCCNGGMCPGTYVRQGNYYFLCHDMDEITIYYWAFTCDGTGEPVVSQNHFEALTNGVAWLLYKPKRFNDKGSRATYQDLKNEYFDSIGEARGMDAWPTTREQWASLGQISRMSTLDAMAKLPDYYGCCELYQDSNELCADVMSIGVYHWQYDDHTVTDANKPAVTQDWLNSNAVQRDLSAFQNGLTIAYNRIGRIGFAVLPTTADTFAIYDILGNNITDVVFDKSYDATLQAEIFISKEIMTHSNIYFKFQ